jgi:uncharacterized membrane-anchored protein YhcB (DUF1043 family)
VRESSYKHLYEVANSFLDEDDPRIKKREERVKATEEEEQEKHKKEIEQSQRDYGRRIQQLELELHNLKMNRHGGYH